MTAIYGIVGDPVAHSLSPAMQMAAFRAHNIDAEYRRFHVRAEHLAGEVSRIRQIPIAGFNVTVPHKEAISALLDEITPEARSIGAVNTVANRGGRLVGYNTDAPGLTDSLRAAGVQIEGAHVVILGAGGAARAAVVGLSQAAARTITVAARQRTAAINLLNALHPAGLALDLDSLDAAFANATVIVQATSATLEDRPGAREFAAGLPFNALPLDAVVVDMVYKPVRTQVLAAAEARGVRTIDGRGMLVHQGARAFEIWTGRTAPLAEMWDTLSAPV